VVLVTADVAGLTMVLGVVLVVPEAVERGLAAGVVAVADGAGLAVVLVTALVPINGLTVVLVVLVVPEAVERGLAAGVVAVADVAGLAVVLVVVVVPVNGLTVVVTEPVVVLSAVVLAGLALAVVDRDVVPVVAEPDSVDRGSESDDLVSALTGPALINPMVMAKIHQVDRPMMPPPLRLCKRDS